MRNNKKYICDKCEIVDERNTIIDERRENYRVKGEDVSVDAKVRICQQCGAEISDEALDELTVQAAFDVYRRNHNIIFPAEIKAIRDTYRLSQRSLGVLLGWGAITIHRYEAGSLPDESHNQVLRLIKDPFNMIRVLEESRVRIDSGVYQSLLSRLIDVLTEQVPAKVNEVLVQSTRQRSASIFTGFVDFEPETLKEMMLFFAHKCKGVLKTKLNKLLWYADFAHYKHHARSISGACYAHYPYGPVPQNYGMYLSSLLMNDTLVLEEIDFGVNARGESMLGESLSSTRNPQVDIFSESAIRALEATYIYFAPMGSKQISDLSHQEEGYKATKDKEFISYAYADQLKADPIT
jgi:putative zinc finger/helix-turn-helix YgiT family protein